MNADQVRAMMPKSVSETVDEITKECAKLAAKGDIEFKTGKYGFGEVNTLDDKQSEIILRLKKLGFRAEHCVEFRQFPLAYLLVNWEVKK